MKQLCVTILAILFITATSATYAAVKSNTNSANRKSVALVLSGGGAKGVAHIGAIKVLEQAGVPIDYIVGTSMGAIIGGLYAIGYDTKTLDSMVRTQDWAELFTGKVSRKDLSFKQRENEQKYMINLSLGNKKRLEMPSGIIEGYNVYNFLSKLTVGYHDSISFGTLPIPFACVAYDLVAGKDVILESGNLPMAMRASMSIPGVFSPIRTDDYVLVDGGISDNYPVDVARRMGAEIVVGVDVGAGMRTKDELNNVVDLFDQMTTIMGLDAARRNIAETDLYVHPNIKPYSAASFTPEALDTLISRGEQAMMENWDNIIELKSKIGVDSTYRPKPQTRSSNQTIFVGKIDIKSSSHLDERSDKIIRKLIDLKEGDSLKSNDIASAVSRLQGTGRFSRISYRLEGTHPPYDLIFQLVPTPINSIGLGLRFDTEGKAAILVNGTISTKSLYGGMFGITARLSQNPYAKLNYDLGGAASHKFGVSYMFLNNNIDLYKNGNKSSNIDFNKHNIDIQLSNIQLNDFRTSIGIEYDYYDFRSILNQNDGSSGLASKGYINYYVAAQYETLDDLYYPTRGLEFNASYTLITDNMIGLEGDSPLSAVAFDFRAPISLGGRTAIIPTLYFRSLFGGVTTFPYGNFMGGVEAGRYFQQQIPFIGFDHTERFNRTLGIARLDFRVRLWSKHYASLIGNVARESNTIGNMFTDGRNIWGGGIMYTYSTPVGPIDLLFDTSSLHKGVGVYFNFGYYF